MVYWYVVDVMPLCLSVSVRLCLVNWVEIFTFHYLHFWRGPFVSLMQPKAPMVGLVVMVCTVVLPHHQLNPQMLRPAGRQLGGHACLLVLASLSQQLSK